MALTFSRRTMLATAAATAVSALAAPHVARAAVRVIKIGHNSIPSSQFGIGCQAMADAVAQHPDLLSTIKIEIHGNAEMGDDVTMLNSCRVSTVDMMVSVTSVAGAHCPEVGLLDVPFVFKDVTRGRAAFAGETGEEFAALMKPKDINVMGWFENGLRHITSNRVVRKPADIVGLKLRVPPSQVAIESFASLGAEAKPLSFNVLYEALRTGQFDAQENPVGTAEDIKLYEVQKYLCLSGHTYSVGFVVMSPDLMEDLSPKQLAAMKECVRAGTKKTQDVADQSSKMGIGRLSKAGMIIIDNVDKDAFGKAAMPNIERMGVKFGPDRVQRLLRAAA